MGNSDPLTSYRLQHERKRPNESASKNSSSEWIGKTTKYVVSCLSCNRELRYLIGVHKHHYKQQQCLLPSLVTYLLHSNTAFLERTHITPCEPSRGMRPCRLTNCITLLSSASYFVLLPRRSANWGRHSLRQPLQDRYWPHQWAGRERCQYRRSADNWCCAMKITSLLRPPSDSTTIWWKPFSLRSLIWSISYS